MDEKIETRGRYHSNGLGQLLYCASCDVFPQVNSYLGTRSCMCTTVTTTLPFPDYWKWVESDDGD